MKKFIALALCAFALAPSALAERISLDKALRRVAADRASYSLVENSPLQIRDAQGQPLAWLVSDGTTVLLLSADDAVAPVLAEIPAENAVGTPPPALQALLQAYAEGNVTAPAADEPFREPIDPLIKTEWSQSGPYATKVPNFYHTGCVATAMAQIIYYHKYMTTTPAIATHTYHCESTNSDLSYNYKNASAPRFNFSAMQRSGNTDPAAREAVADLMYACGVAVDMQYGPNGSDAPDALVAGAMANYFGYVAEGCAKFVRANSDDSRWIALLYNELEQKRPVLYTSNAVEGGGHAYILDGYAENGNWHINWGWGGQWNGYYSLSNLYANGGTWTIGQGFTSIMPPAKTESPITDGPKVYAVMHYAGSYRLDLTYTMTEWGIPTEVTPGVKVVPANGRAPFYNTISDEKITLQPGSVHTQSLKEFSPSDAVMSGNGTFDIYPALRLADGTWIDGLERMAMPYSVHIALNGGIDTTKDNPVSLHKLTINSVTHDEIIPCTGGKVNFHMTLTNPSDTDFRQQVIALLSRDGTYETRIFEPYWIWIDLPGNETKTFDFDWDIYPVYDKGGKKAASSTVEPGFYKFSLVESIYVPDSDDDIYQPRSANIANIAVGREEPDEYPEIDPTPDGINSVTVSTPDTYYDLQGRRVANPVRGLYIRNGQKIMIK